MTAKTSKTKATGADIRRDLIDLARLAFDDGYCLVSGEPSRHMIAARPRDESCVPICWVCRLATLHDAAKAGGA